MKQKIRTAIEADVLRRAKRQAADGERPLSDLIKVRNLLGLGLRFESCAREDLLQSAFALQRRCGLLANDTVVLAVATISKTLPGGRSELRC